MASEWDETLEALADLRRYRSELDAAERHLVEEARRSGIVWRLIAEALGVTTTAAHKRYRALDPRSRRRERHPIDVELDAVLDPARASRPSTKVLRVRPFDFSTRVRPFYFR